MKANHHHHPKLKTPLFTCGLFGHCSSSSLSPTTPHPPPLPISPPLSSSSPPPQLPPPPPQPKPTPKKPDPNSSTSSSSSSSASTSQSFTQWKFPLLNSPLPNPNPNPNPNPPKFTQFTPSPTNYTELFHLAELQLSSGSDPDRLGCLHLLERTLVPNPVSDPVCPVGLMRLVVGCLREAAAAKSATKILLALCLAEANRRVAVEAGAVAAVVEVAAELEGASAERALAALDLACTVAEGAAVLRAHALAVPVMVAMMGKMAGRGKEYAMSALAVVYGGGDREEGMHAPPEEVARAVELALQQGDCTERGWRKGALLLKALKEYNNNDSNNNNNEGGEPLDFARDDVEHGNERS